MSEYTQIKEWDTYYNIDDDKLNDFERLTEILESFRTFDEAMYSFICSHGYDGKPDDNISKKEFIASKFKLNEIALPREINKWFSGELSSIKKETGIQVCFAFGLSIDDADDFFRRVLLLRSFDYHSASECIAYFCLKNNITYSEYLKIKDKINDILNADKSFTDDEKYTNTIKSEIDTITTVEELVEYFSNHGSDFKRHHISSINNIRELYSELEHLYKIKERKISRSKFLLEMLGLLETDPITGKRNSYLDVVENEHNVKFDRKITPALKSNPIVNKYVRDSFPDRDKLTDVWDENKASEMSEESIRKLLIFLAFFNFWKKYNISNHSNDGSFSERCKIYINNYLTDSAYPELYYGNPYDWLFLMCSTTEDPILTFQVYIGDAIDYKYPSAEE